MDSKLLLVKTITLLYWESQLKNNNDSSHDLVRNIIKDVVLPDTVIETDHSRQIIDALKSTSMYMVDQPSSHTYDKNSLLQRLQINLSEESGIYLSVKDVISQELENEKVLELVAAYRRELYNHINRGKVQEMISKAAATVRFDGDNIDWNSFVAEFHQQLEPFASGMTDVVDDDYVGSVDLSNTDAMEEVIEEAQKEMSVEGIMKLGYQAINRMCGWMGGFRRGDMIVLGALQHNYKSGLVLDFFRQIAMYNKPYLLDPTKKPLLLFLSLENSINDNIVNLYIKLKEMETGVKITDIRAIDKKEAAAYVSEKLTAQGYHVKMLRYNPSEFTFRKLFDMLNRLEAEGYEIHALFVDYLNMMSKEGCDQSNTSATIRDLFRRVRNFCTAKKITCITPHQLSTEAKSLLRQGCDYFVKEITNKGYWADSKQIDQEMDFGLYCHIEKSEGVSYLTLQRDKHRQGGPVTPEQDLYTVLKFQPVGGIHDDINGEDLSQRRVGSVGGNGGGASWYD